MDTERKAKHLSLAFINDKSPILDTLSQDLLTSGFEILFKSDNIKDGITQLSELKALPLACIIDLDFYDTNVLAQLDSLKGQYPSVKLIAHSDIDEEKTVKSILEIGFTGYLLIGSDIDEFKKVIDGVING